MTEFNRANGGAAVIAAFEKLDGLPYVYGGDEDDANVTEPTAPVLSSGHTLRSACRSRGPPRSSTSSIRSTPGACHPFRATCCSLPATQWIRTPATCDVRLPWRCAGG